MGTRRAFFSGLFVVLLAAAGAARADKGGPLEVTYYYLPG